MNRNKLKNYAPQARREFITAVTDRAAYYGLTKQRIEPITEQGDVALISGKPFPRHLAEKRTRLEGYITQQGFEQVMEAMPIRGSTGWSPSVLWNCTATWTTATES
jgi:hypothetical protein